MTRNRILPLILAVIGCSTIAPTTFAQTTFSGTVVDAHTEEGLPGVSIFVAGTTFGTATDRDGRFTFRIGDSVGGLSFSSVGYRTLTLPASQLTPGVIISLEPTFIDLSPLVVSASREMEPRAYVPAAVSTLSASQIEHTKPSMLYQALNQIAGVHMVDLGNEQYKMSIRQPFTNKAYFLYMEDGVPVRPTGIFNPNALIDINMAGIDRVEVLRGPVSATYGSNAVAGAVNFITPAPSPVPGAKLSARMDNYGYRRTDFSAGSVIGKLGVVIGGYAARQRDAFYDHSDFDKLSLTFRVNYKLSNATGLENSFTLSRLDTDTNGALDSLNFYTRGISSLHTFTYRKMNAARARSTLAHAWSSSQRTRITAFFRNNKIEQLPYWKVRRSRSNPAKATGEINQDSFWSLGLIGQHEIYLKPKDSHLVLGASFDASPATYWAEYIDVSRDGEGRYVSFAAPDSMLTDYSIGIRNTAAFARFETNPLGKLRVVASLRYDHLAYDYDNHLDASAYSGAPDEISTFDRVSPKIGLTYDLDRGRGLYANYSLGFAPPEVNELYNGVKIPQLNPASFESFEFGGWAALVRGKLFLEGSFYAMDGTDEIIPVIMDDGSRENRNAGHTRHRGIEYTLLYQPGGFLSIRLSGTNASHAFVTFNENGNDYSGNDMMNAPRWIANGEISVSPSIARGLRLSAEWQHVSSYLMDNGNTATYDGHDVFYVRASFSRSNWTVWANLNNVFDDVFAATAAAYSFGTLYNAGQVRTLTAGVDYSF